MTKRVRMLMLAVGAVPLVGLSACTVSSGGGYRDRYDDRPGYVERREYVETGPRDGDWVLLGRTAVDTRPRPDHDTIPIGHREGRFKRIYFFLVVGDIVF